MNHRRSLLAGLSCALGAACTGGPPVSARDPVRLAPVAAAPTTLEQTFAPRAKDAAQGKNPALPGNVDAYVAAGYDRLERGPGEDYVVHTFDEGPAPALGPAARRLVRFVHLADFQLPDDESPTRVGLVDNAGVLSSALRPQDADLCRLTNASVRTVNALHRQDPIDFVVLGGDNIDSAQENELDWVMQILDGADSVECDAGDDDDIIAGPDNDGKDPFFAEGLLMPWKWVTGNHDVLVQGNFAVTASNQATAVSGTTLLGTRDYSSGLGGAVSDGDWVVPDPRRALLTRQTMMQKIATDADGHGIGEAQKRSGKAYYDFDVPGTPLVFLIIDASTEAGGGNGLIHQADVDAYVLPVLERARREGKWVVLASHQGVDNLTQDGGEFGSFQEDALHAEQWRQLLADYDNVLFSLVGHYHTHGAHRVQPASNNGRGYWEIVTASISDFPNQFRTVEIWDGDNGFVLLRATVMDLALDDDAVAAAGRELSVIDYTSGWNPNFGMGETEARNIELWIPKPAVP